MTNTKCAENEQKLWTELIKNLSQLKSHPQQKIKSKDKGREMQTQGQHNDVLSKRKSKPSTKNLSAALQAISNPLENVVGIHKQQ